MVQRIVVIGGVAAGMSAASQAKRRDPNCEVTVLQRGAESSYSACGMPYNVGDPSRAMDDLVILKASTARGQRGIDVRTRHEVLGIDIAQHRVNVIDLDTQQRSTLPWDKLVLATGALALRPKLPGLDLPGVFVLREFEDGRAIKQFLSEHRVEHAVIVGAGYIGIEMADVLHGLGLKITMLEKAAQILPGFARAIVDVAAQELQRNAVTALTGVGLRAVRRDGTELVIDTDSDALRAQLVIIAVGTQPDVALAKAAGITLGESGAIAVDSGMRTSAPDVYAAGDCAEALHLVLNRPVWIPLGTTANKQGKVAGANAASANESFAGIVGSAGFKLFGLEVARTGLGQADIDRFGIDAVAAMSQHHSRARNYPGDAPTTTIVYAERGSGRLLGAQMIGAESVAKRVDIFATALHARMTLEQVEALDLAYAPPFSPVMDPVLIAANVGLKALAKARP